MRPMRAHTVGVLKTVGEIRERAGIDVRLVTDVGVEDRPLAALPGLLEQEEGLVWVDVPHPGEEAGRVLTECFGFHPLAVQDALERNRVPKTHGYADHVFFVLHEPSLGANGHVHYVELDQFVGPRYLVTVHGPVNPRVAPDVPGRATEAVLTRLREGRLRPRSAFELSHAVVSELVRHHEDFLEQLTADVWRLEQQVTGGRPSDPEVFVAELFRARHGLLAVRTMAAQAEAMCARIACLPRISEPAQEWVGEMAHDFEKVLSVADGEREYLQGVIDFYQTVLTLRASLATQDQNESANRLTEASYRQNEELKKISAWAAISFAPTLVGTVYGMNFDSMPELHWSLGYPLALLLMVATSLVLYRVFRRSGWL